MLWFETHFRRCAGYQRTARICYARGRRPRIFTRPQNRWSRHSRLAGIDREGTIMANALSARDLEQRPDETAAEWRRRLQRLKAGELDMSALAVFDRLLRQAEEAARQESAGEEVPPSKG
jgi:hypothetical protein